MRWALEDVLYGVLVKTRGVYAWVASVGAVGNLGVGKLRVQGLRTLRVLALLIRNLEVDLGN